MKQRNSEQAGSYFRVFGVRCNEDVIRVGVSCFRQDCSIYLIRRNKKMIEVIELINLDSNDG